MSEAIRPSARATSFTESVIREMTRLATAHDAINLAQGFPGFPAPEEVKRAAQEAVAADLNQYPITWGEQELREAIGEKYARTYGMGVDPDRNVCVTCGSTEAMIASILGILDPGDEVVVHRAWNRQGPAAARATAVGRGHGLPGALRPEREAERLTDGQQETYREHRQEGPGGEPGRQA